jgi:hypothetical protein
MKSIEETIRNKNRMFLVCFSSAEIYRLGMIVYTLPKTFARSIKRNESVPFAKGRECNFRVRGAKRANTLIKYFVSSMPQVKCDIYSASYAS